MAEKKPKKTKIGLLNESTLHNQIKKLYLSENCESEKRLGRYVIDVIADDYLIEIQTRNFYSIKSKLKNLLKNQNVLLVHPIFYEKMLVYVDEDGNELSRRKSPKKGRIIDIYKELMRVPGIVKNPNFSLEIVLSSMEEFRCRDGKGSWRRKGVSIVNRSLVEVLDKVRFDSPKDYLRIMPAGLEDVFTTSKLANKANIPRHLANKVTYTMRRIGTFKKIGTLGREYLYEINS